MLAVIVALIIIMVIALIVLKKRMRGKYDINIDTTSVSNPVYTTNSLYSETYMMTDNGNDDDDADAYEKMK